MRKLFLSFLITLGAFAAPNLWAGGKVQSPGTSLVDKGKTVTLETYLKTICGATFDSENGTWSMNTSTAPSDAAEKDVYFVAINDYWIGSSGAPSDATTSSDYSFYDQVNEGVDYIIKVDKKSMQTTLSGRFYTHEAENVDKFFFIERRSAYRTKSANGGNYDSSWSPFGWYNEWSYVENTDGGYTSLTPSLGDLSDGAPFFSPHNCDTSLETNHYITLNGRDDHTTSGYYFTAYLYIPNEEDIDEDYTTVNTGKMGYASYGTYTVRAKSGNRWTSVANAPDSWYIMDENGDYVQFKTSSYKDQYYRSGEQNDGTVMTIYTYQEIKKKVYNNVPYVFFYRIKLGEIDDAGSISSTLNKTGTPILDTDMNCYHTVDLDWGTSFDIYSSWLSNTSYDTMKEHFIIQRSFDKTNWETIGTKDLEENKVKNNVADYNKGTSNAADYKTFTDNTLPDFDETTKKIGYTVYYRIVSEVQKSDGTVMSTTTSNDITVNIPGTTPFKLTLEAGGTSKYTPGTMDVDNYNEGSNLFVNTLTAGRSLTSTGDPTLGTESVLNLVCTTFDAEGNKSEEVIAFASCATYGTSSLDALINAIGKVQDDVTTAAGEKYDAQYQLVLELGDGKRVESNIVKIVNSKVSNTSVSVHRSGTPDAATCATSELFRNEVKFKPQMSAVPGAGYYIYCNGEKVLTLNDNTNSKDFTGDNGTKYTVDADGYITMTFFAEHAPIAVGETGTETITGFHYAVVHFDAAGNTYGSAAKASDYDGSKDELVVMFSTTTSTLGSHYDLVFIRPVLNWNLNKSECDDVASPIRYDIYMKIEQAQFEIDGEKSSGRTGNVKGWEGDNFGKYILRGSVNYGDGSTSYADEIYYARRQQETGTWVNPIADDEIRPVSYYVKAVYSDDAVVKQNVKEKNSDVFAVKASAGGIFTAIEGVSAEGVSVEANDGLITVTGAIGTIVVYSATGQAVATAQGDGGVTTIDASNLNGVYIVKADNMKPTKILIK